MSQEFDQGYFLGPLLFNIYLNDLFCLSEFTNLCNFADDATFYACDMDLNSLTKRLKHDSFLAIEWFENNNTKLTEVSVTCSFLDTKMKMFELIWNRTNREQKRVWKAISRNC